MAQKTATKFWNDTLETLEHEGKKVGKGIAKSLNQTFNPIAAAELQRENEEQKQKMEIEMKKKGNHTPLDFEKLQKSLKSKEEEQMETLRQRLFQLVKTGDEKNLEDEKREEVEEKEKEKQEAEEKKKQIEEQKRVQSAETPKGKERKSILGPTKKKAIMEQQNEVRPSSSKN